MNDGTELSRAAKRLEHPGAWHQGSWTGPDGSVCLVQSVIDAEGYRGYNSRYGGMSDENFKAVDHTLRFSPYYRLRKVHARISGQSAQHAAMAWNDAPWRRRQSVVEVLKESATYAHKAFVINDRIRLQMEVERLKRELEAVQARVADLESENVSLLRRVANMRAMKREIAALDDLDQELDVATRKLQGAARD